MPSRVQVVLGLAVLLLLTPVALPAVLAAPGPAIQGDAQAVAELKAIYDRFAAQRSWRSRMTMPGTTFSMISEFVAPDRMHLIMSQGGQPSGEYYVIGNAMYVKSGRECTRLPQKVSFPNPREQAQTDPGAVIQVVRSAPEVVDGTPTQTYALTITSQGKTFRQKMYAATATGLIRRLETVTAEGTMLIDYLDYGAGVTINDPPC